MLIKLLLPVAALLAVQCLEQDAAAQLRSGVSARVDPVPKAQRRPVPIESIDGTIVFPITIAGEPVWAVLDTGAESSVVDLKFARELRLDLDESRVGRLRTVDNGNLRAIGVRDFPITLAGQLSMTLPKAVAADLDMVSRSVGRPVAFVFGANFFRNFAISVDPFRRTLEVAPSGLRPGARAIAVPLRAGELSVDVMANGQPLRLAIDTGSRSDLSLTPEAAERAGLLRPTTAWIGAYGATNVIAEIRPQPPDVGDGRLGMGILGRVGVILDVKAGRMWLIPPPSR